MSLLLMPTLEECLDCGGYAPHTPAGDPLWSGPRCTECAKRAYAARHGCCSDEAELRLIAERQAAVATSLPATVSGNGETTAAPAFYIARRPDTGEIVARHLEADFCLAELAEALARWVVDGWVVEYLPPARNGCARKGAM